MNIASKLSLIALSLTLLLGSSCSKQEAADLERGMEADTLQTVEVNVRIEASASMPEVDDELRAGGLQLKFIDGTPLFRMNGDDGTIDAHCVFKPLKAGSTTELDDSRALYGTLTFKRKSGSEPSLKDGKAVAVELISEGKVTLKGNTKFKTGDTWYVMGMVGGTASKDGKSVEVKGSLLGFENNGQSTGIDTQSRSIPFLSQWVKMSAINEGELATYDPIRFKFQGIIFTLDVKNGTNYSLTPHMLELQSSELVNHVLYDLGSSSKITDTEADVRWEKSPDAPTDQMNRWFIIRLGLGNGYKLDPKNLATNGNFLYDKTEPAKNKVTAVFWVNALGVSSIKRTGIFISSTNDEAKPAWDEVMQNGKVTLSPNMSEGTHYKYALTSDPNIDGIVRTGVLDTNNPLSRKSYSSDIRMAPSMDGLCVKTLQRSIANNRGKYIHLTVTIPERPVMPIETMAQNNMYSYRNNGNGINFVGFPGADRYDRQMQTADYTKGFTQASENNSSYWMLPNLKHWHGILMSGHNRDNAHNFNEIAYGFFEGDGGDLGKEEVEFADGSTGTYYAVYGRPLQSDINNHRVYGLRFFRDEAHTEGTNQFALSRYTSTTYGGRDVLVVESVWLGPEYAKLYDGVHRDQRAWLREIANNDNDGEGSLFRQLRKSFVTRYLIVERSGTRQYNFSVPGTYNRDMIGYFYGPSSLFASSARAKAIAYKNHTLFTGPSQDLGVDFTNYNSTGNAEAYVRPIRRGFIAFPYKI